MSRLGSERLNTGGSAPVELTGDAAVGNVLAPKTFYNTDPDAKRTGTMPNRANNDVEISDLTGTLIPAGYYDGTGRAKLSAAEQAKVIGDNIAEDVTLLGVPGTHTGGGGSIDEYTKVLLHFDGDNDGTTFTDSSGKTWTATGTAKISTAQKAYGSASLLLDGNSDFISTPDSADFNFGADPFTIDCWIYPLTVAAGSGNIIGQADDVNNRWALYRDTAGIVFYAISGGTVMAHYLTSGVGLTINRLCHVEIGRNGTNLYIFINGVSIGGESTAVSTNAMPNLAADVIIGCRKYPGTEDRYLYAYLDEMRVSKGICRHTADFAVGQPYPG